MDKKQTENHAVELLDAVWKGMDDDFKKKYAREIWQIFENRIRVAANQNATLSRFITQLTRTLSATLGTNAQDRIAGMDALESGNDAAVLKFLREETTLAVLYVRQRNDVRRAQREADYESRRALQLEIAEFDRLNAPQKGDE